MTPMKRLLPLFIAASAYAAEDRYYSKPNPFGTSYVHLILDNGNTKERRVYMDFRDDGRLDGVCVLNSENPKAPCTFIVGPGRLGNFQGRPIDKLVYVGSPKARELEKEFDEVKKAVEKSSGKH